jgi:hypothetical protein
MPADDLISRRVVKGYSGLKRVTGSLVEDILNKQHSFPFCLMEPKLLKLVGLRRNPDRAVHERPYLANEYG